MPPLLLASMSSAPAMSTPPAVAGSPIGSNRVQFEQTVQQPDKMIKTNVQPHAVSTPELLEMGPRIGLSLQALDTRFNKLEWIAEHGRQVSSSKALGVKRF